jgi:DNA-binding NtrC family response regulator
VDHDSIQNELGIIGRSPQIAAIVEMIRRIAPTDIGVLLVGESGVGKEVIANAIHQLSRRAKARMISINCGAIPETLLESELFGHEKGAFTGAVESRKGLFEAANGGTIFLDEIGDMPLATQVKLLRVLETFEFTRVGTSDARKTDVRIIAATNRDLERDVARGVFRQDLYYRLRSIQIRIPPLKERPIDIPLFVDHFARISAARLGIRTPRISDDAIDILVRHPWTGNVRELKHFVEMIITLEGEKDITADSVMRHLEEAHVPTHVDNPNAIVHLAGRTPEQAERELIYRVLLELRNEVATLRQTVYTLASQIPQKQNHPALPAPAPTPENIFERLAGQSLEEVERGMILAALRKFKGNRRHAARALGISERTLYRKLNEYGTVDIGLDTEEPTGEEPSIEISSEPEGGIRTLSDEEWRAMKTRTS